MSELGNERQRAPIKPELQAAIDKLFSEEYSTIISQEQRDIFLRKETWKRYVPKKMTDEAYKVAKGTLEASIGPISLRVVRSRYETAWLGMKRVDSDEIHVSFIEHSWSGGPEPSIAHIATSIDLLNPGAVDEKAAAIIEAMAQDGPGKEIKVYGLGNS